MPKPILFVDFDGVLCHQKFWFSLAEPTHEYHFYHGPIGNLVFKQNVCLVNDWMAGKYKSEEIHEFIAKKFNLDFAKLFNIFKEDCASFNISESLLAAIGNLQSKYYTICRTDNMDCFERFILPANPKMHEVFNEIDNSYNLKSLKNLEYYKSKILSVSANPEECVLIDDSHAVTGLFKQVGGRVFNLSQEDLILQALDNLYHL